MELFIIGGILLVVMVIVSTVIKRSAAGAFKTEEIRADDFSVTKPEGYMHPLREESEFAFEAYSKEFGDRSERNIWRSRVRLRIHEGDSVDKILNEIRDEEVEVSIENREAPKAVIVASEKTRDGTTYAIRRNISRANGKTYELRATTIKQFEGEFSDKVGTLLESFTLNRG